MNRHIIKKTISTILLIALLSSCAPIPKFEMSYKGNPPLITYSEVIKTSLNKNINYENVLKAFMEAVPDAKLKNDDKGNCYFQVIGYMVYDYKGKNHKCSYILSFQGENTECSLTINQLRIMHYNIERMYFDKKRRTRKKFNHSYEDIQLKLTALMTELVKQIK